MPLGVEATEAAADAEGGDDDDYLEQDEADQDQHGQGNVVRQLCHHRGDTTLQGYVMYSQQTWISIILGDTCLNVDI